MARIVGYIATSLDGFIADANESLDWLLKYNDMDFGEFGYTDFAKRIRTVVMGRATYDWIAKQNEPWAYADKRAIVVTSRPIANPMGELETRHDVEALIAELRGLTDGDVWMIGGGKLQMAFMERKALDEIEIYVMPELVGGGYPLFPPTGFRATPRLLSAHTLDRGVVRLHYALT